MNVALCLQGQPRNWRPAEFFLKKEVINKYNADVFGHTWWKQPDEGESYSVAPFAPQYKKYMIESNTIEDLNNSYNFKKFKYDSPRNFITGKQYKVGVPEKHDSIVDALRSRYFSLKSVLTLLEEYEKEKNISYDWVCVSRYDISIKLMENLILLHPHYHYVEDWMHSGRKYILNDNFWIFPKRWKFVFKNLYDDFDITYEKMVNGDLTESESKIIEGTELTWEHVKVCNGEQMMAYHLLFNGALQYAVQSKQFRYEVIP